VSEEEPILDSATARDIVRAAISVWNQTPVHERATCSAVAPDRFAVAGTSSPRGSVASVSLSFPRLPPEVFFEWLGPRLVFWPAGIVSSRRTSIVSSRIGKRRDLKRGWFDALRTAVIRQQATECLCCVSGTAAAEAVVRASELFGARRLRIEVEPDESASEAELVAWLEAKTSVHQPSESTLEDVVYVSSTCQADTNHRSCVRDRNSQSSSIRDATLVLTAERIVALSCRAGGHVESLLNRHLQDERCEASVLLASVAASEAEPVSPSLVSLGAVRWLLGRGHADAEVPRTADSDRARDSASSQAESQRRTRSSMSDGPLQVPDTWLCHWTRPRQGPWTEQSDEEFLDELILGCQTADRSAYAALLRMVEQCRITASQSVKNAAKTVSFTAVPLGEFRNRRVYRKHKLRFDFEPWGIAVRRSALEKYGCRPVTYVDRETYDDAVPDVRLLQQLKTDEGHQIDWSPEREWRYTGDLDLSRFGVTDVVAFVDTHDEATALNAVTPWRVLELPLMTKPA
jgi:hypothetical protein